MNFKGDPSDRRENEGGAGIGPDDPKYGIISNNDVRNLGLKEPDGWEGGEYPSNNNPKLGTNPTVPRLDDLNPADRLSFGMGANGENLAGPTLIPYWNTKAATCESKDINDKYTDIDDIINWSCSYNSDLQVLKCCSYGKNLHRDTHTPIGADYILCGEMSGEGSITVFALRESGACAFGASGFHTPKYNLAFVLGGFDVSKDEPKGVPKTVLIPNALINSGSTSMATGASYISCDYSFTAMGDGVNGVMLMTDGDLTAKP